MAKKSSAAQTAGTQLEDSISNETMLLAGMLKNGKEYFAQTADILNENSFYIPKNRAIYTVIKSLFDNGKDINCVSVISAAENIVDSHEINQLVDIPSPDLKQSRDLATKLKSRLAIKESVNLHKKAIDQLLQMSETENLAKVFGVSESTLFDLISKFSNSNDDIIKVGKNARSLVEFWATNPVENVGLPTPWPRFNKSIGGGMRTGVTLIGARSGKGKSLIGIITAIYLSNLGIPVLFLDTEMEYKDVLPRMLANIASVPISKIENGSFYQNDFDRKAVEGAITQIESSSMFYKTIAGKSFDEIMSIIRRWIYTDVGIAANGKANQCLVIYDYFKIMDSGDIGEMAEFQAMGFQISKLTDFCKKYDFPCMSFVQLNRDGVAKEGTDVIAQSDRLLWLCNSFSIFKEKSVEDQEENPNNGNRKIVTLKSRYGGEAESSKDHISMQFNRDLGSLKEVVVKTNDGPPK